MDRGNEGDVLEYASPGRTRVARPPRPPVVRIVVLGLVLFPLIVAALYPVARSAQYRWQTLAVTEVPTGRTRPDGFPAVIRISTHGPGQGPSTPMAQGSIDYPYYAGGPRFGMKIDLRDMTCWPTTDWNRSQVSLPLTHKTISAELKTGGFDSATGEVSSLTNSIMTEVQKLAGGQLPAFDAAGRGNRPPTYRVSWMDGTRWPNGRIWWPWYTPWCVPMWLIAWFLVGRWLLRRHRRRLAAFKGERPREPGLAAS